jgi:hypothetical protein
MRGRNLLCRSRQGILFGSDRRHSARPDQQIPTDNLIDRFPRWRPGESIDDQIGIGAELFADLAEI